MSAHSYHEWGTTKTTEQNQNGNHTVMIRVRPYSRTTIPPLPPFFSHFSLLTSHFSVLTPPDIYIYIFQHFPQTYFQHHQQPTFLSLSLSLSLIIGKMKKEGEEDDRDLSKLIPADTTLSAIPPLLTQGAPSSSSPSRKRTRAHELGLETERGRREKMSDLYALLQTMVPTLFPKVLLLLLRLPSTIITPFFSFFLGFVFFSLIIHAHYFWFFGFLFRLRE